ncbi:hypothetical protein CU098_008666, partial [Rhizopus stolonifer]
SMESCECRLYKNGCLLTKKQLMREKTWLKASGIDVSQPHIQKDVSTGIVDCIVLLKQPASQRPNF